MPEHAENMWHRMGFAVAHNCNSHPIDRLYHADSQLCNCIQAAEKNSPTNKFEILFFNHAVRGKWSWMHDLYSPSEQTQLRISSPNSVSPFSFGSIAIDCERIRERQSWRVYLPSVDPWRGARLDSLLTQQVDCVSGPVQKNVQLVSADTYRTLFLRNELSGFIIVKCHRIVPIRADKS